MARKVKPQVFFLDIELTQRCNNDCIHCCVNLPEDDEIARSKELSTAQLKDILGQAAKLGCVSVRLTGGEPLLREDFEDIYISARKLGMVVTIFTNATLLTKRLVNLFKNIPPLQNIEVSIYGMHKCSYEKTTRTPGSFQAAWRGINLLLEKGVLFSAKGALFEHNVKEADEFNSWCKNNLPWMKEAPPYALFYDMSLRRERPKNRKIGKLRFPASEGVKILTKDKEAYLRNAAEFLSRFSGPHGDQLFSCGAAKNRGCVNAYGYFQPCLLLRHNKYMRDLKKVSLREALIDLSRSAVGARATSVEYIKKCARCFLRDSCEQCPAKSWLETGALDRPVRYFCDIAHAHGEAMGLLKKGEKTWGVKNWQTRVGELLNVKNKTRSTL